MLLEWNGKITDPYSGKQYRKYLNIYNSGLLYHDTWEMFEPHIDKVKRLGFDGMIIYEGGIENYICFQSEQYQVIENQE